MRAMAYLLCSLIVSPAYAAQWGGYDSGPADASQNYRFTQVNSLHSASERLFRVHTPSGWTVRSGHRNGQIVLVSRDGEHLIIWPYFVRQPLRANGAKALLMRFAGVLDDRFKWQAPQQVGSNMLRTIALDRNDTGLAAIVWMPGGSSTVGYVYYIKAPAQLFHQHSKLYASILRSFHLTGNGSRNPVSERRRDAQVAMVAWQDPREHAFELRVPRGWSVHGGLFRRSSLDTVDAVDMVSPDRRIYLFIGDPRIPVFTEPTQTLNMSGFREGTWYSPGYGQRMMVMRYNPGDRYATGYVEHRFGGQYQGFRITASRARPDMTQRINQIYQQNNMPMFREHLSIGEVAFTFSDKGRTKAGYTMAGTQLLQANGYGASSGIWTVKYLDGFVAPVARIGEARALLAKAVSSFRVNPAWVRMQQGVTGNVSQMVTETNTYISRTISQTYGNAQRTNDESARKYSNYILGEKDIRDPDSGKTYKVESGSNYYWIDNLGDIAGTKLSANPNNLRFKQMLRLP